MAEQPKPCPFCGGKPERVAKRLDERFAYAIEVAYVCRCGCRRVALGDSSKGGYADNSKVEDLALSAWNTRAPTASPPAACGLKGIEQMKIFRAYTTVADGKHVGENKPFEVEIDIDIDEIARTLAARAVHSKSKRAVVMHGALKCRVVKSKESSK